MSRKIYFRHSILIGFLLLTINVLWSQSRSNPFEIKQRLGVVSDVGSKEINNSKPSEPIFSSDSSLLNEKGLNNSITLKNSVTITEENPFEVDHVPLRRSVLGKQSTNKKLIGTTMESNSFLFWFLLFSCGLLAIVLNTNAKGIELVTRSLFNENVLKLFYRNESTRFSLYLILIYFIFAINFGVFIYLITSYYNGPKGILILLMILSGVICAYSLKHVGLNLIGSIFKVSRNTELYSFTILVFNSFIGLCLIPINFFIAFGPTSIHEILIAISFVLVIVFVLIRLFRGIFIVSEYLSNRIFQIFIYLCAFEIAPVLILVKSVMNWSN